MKIPLMIILVVIFFLSVIRVGFGNTLKKTIDYEIYSKTDSDLNHVNLKILKVNPIQAFFCEIPVSLEIFQKLKKSTQIQLGLILPMNIDFTQLFFGSPDNNTSTGLFSYRTSPFNNYGLSFKIEFRKYRRFLYYAPQLMYKYCFYNKEVFHIKPSGITLNKIESKSSNIFGLGFMIGRQSYYGPVIIDRYAGVGLRIRSLSYRIIEIENPWHSEYNTYPNEEKNLVSFYPIINLGIRIGIKL
jgi:hypothetical protein